MTATLFCPWSFSWQLKLSSSFLNNGYSKGFFGFGNLAANLKDSNGPYLLMQGISAIIVTLYLGGWKGPVLPPFLWFLIKIFAVFFLMFWIRSTIPRLRIDQVMAFAWKFLFPLALINLLITAVQVLVWTEALPWAVVFLNLAIMAVLVILWSKLFKLGGGRVEV